MQAFLLVAPIAGVSALLLLATFLITKSRKAAWSIFAVLTLMSLALMAVSVHRLFNYHYDVNPTGALLETYPPLKTQIFTPEQWEDHLFSISHAIFWLFWPMMASNVLWIGGGLLLLRRTRSSGLQPRDSTNIPDDPS